MQVLQVLALLLMVGAAFGAFEQRFTVIEESPIGSLVGTVQVSGADSYNMDDPYFSLGETTGALKVKKRIDRDADPTLCNSGEHGACVHTVMAMAMGTMVPVKVTVKDKNDNKPRWENKVIRIKIPENTLTVRPLPMAIDLDEGKNGITNYTLRVTSSVFSVSAESTDAGIIPKLHVLRPLNREEKALYNRTLMATDGDHQIADVNLLIEVTDVNDESPKFQRSSYSGSVKEDAERDTFILKVNAVDQDVGKNAEVVYAIAPENLLLLKGAFKIDKNTGDISVNESSAIDFEKKQYYDFKVTATDRGEPPNMATSSVRVGVIDTNDHKPEIKVWNKKEIFENKDPGQFVAYIKVKDADRDEAGNVDCTIDRRDFQLSPVSPQGGADALAMSVKMFTLKTSARFDREKTDSYTVILTCRDNGRPQQTETERIPIPIADVNDNAPTFNSVLRTYHVPEEQQQVITVQAEDIDEGDNSRLSYKLLWDDRAGMGENPFQIDNNGQITVLPGKRIDREFYLDPITRKVKPLTFTVQATDRGKPPKFGKVNITIIITDKNDNAPNFEKSEYTFDIEEHSGDGKDVGRVMATDADDPKHNGLIKYRIAEEDVPFKIHNDGVIWVKRDLGNSLDREQIEQFTFKVLAYDMATRHLERKTATATVNVKLIDINDNSPRFRYPNDHNPNSSHPLHLSYREPVNHILAHVKAVDPDKDINGEVRYGIQRGNLFSYFGIDEKTGVLKIIKAMNSELVGNIQLTLTARDLGKNSRQATQVLYLKIDASAPIGKLVGDGRSDMEMNKVIIIGIVITTGIICAVLITAICVMARRQPCLLACPSGAANNHELVQSSSPMKNTKMVEKTYGLPLADRVYDHRLGSAKFDTFLHPQGTNGNGKESGPCLETNSESDGDSGKGGSVNNIRPLPGHPVQQAAPNSAPSDSGQSSVSPHIAAAAPTPHHVHPSLYHPQPQQYMPLASFGGTLGRQRPSSCTRELSSHPAQANHSGSYHTLYRSKTPSVIYEHQPPPNNSSLV